MQETVYPTEGVKLSGAYKGKDCIRIAVLENSDYGYRRCKH